MKLKKTNSKKHLHNRGPTPSKGSKQSVTENGEAIEEENIDYEDFTSDEEPEEDEDTQKDDMKMYLGKLNTRIEKICVALKNIDSNLSKPKGGQKGGSPNKKASVDQSGGKSIAD